MQKSTRTIAPMIAAGRQSRQQALQRNGMVSAVKARKKTARLSALMPVMTSQFREHPRKPGRPRNFYLEWRKRPACEPHTKSDASFAV
jgi:hypothetical protein